MSRYTKEDIRENLSRYGTVYFPDDIKENVEDIKGNSEQKKQLDNFFNALKNYIFFAEKLRKTTLAPNLTVLLYGPPGTGKTSLTRAYAKKNNIPVCVIESDRLVSSLLGDTIKNIRSAVETAADIAKKNQEPFIIFFDEIDAIGSERSNVHEVGEIKRAVISFLQTIDRINYLGIPLAIFGATNHQHQLDSAIWRRFTFHLQFEFPDFELRTDILKSFFSKLENADIKIDKQDIYDKLDDEALKIKGIIKELESRLNQEISEYDGDVLQNELEKSEDIDGLLKLSHGYSGSDLERGIRVALFEAIGENNILNYETIYKSLKLVGGTAIHLEDYSNANISRSRENETISGVNSTKTSLLNESKKITSLKNAIASFEELIKELPNVNPFLKRIPEIIKYKENLRNDYMFNKFETMTEFINNIKNINKELLNKNIN